jgi:hypothetical protein
MSGRINQTYMMQRLKSATRLKPTAAGSQVTSQVAVLLKVSVALERKIQELSETTRIPREILAAEAIRRGMTMLVKS